MELRQELGVEDEDMGLAEKLKADIEKLDKEKDGDGEEGITSAIKNALETGEDSEVVGEVVVGN